MHPLLPPLALSLLLIGLSFLAVAATAAEDYQPRVDYGAVLEEAGVILHGVGQNERYALVDYLAQVDEATTPLLWMDYHAIHPEQNAEDIRELVAELTGVRDGMPDDLRFQLGLSFKDRDEHPRVAEAIAAGELDDYIAALGDALATLERPIYARIGYEANGHWNKYRAKSYPAAFRRIAGILRARIPVFASVWCIHPGTNIDRVMAFDPGDEAADWWSVDLFEPKLIGNKTTRRYLELAHERGKPVMIGESTPTRIGVHAKDAWQRWYEPYFELIRRSPGIKAICYINRNWRYNNLADWGDTRIGAVPAIREGWQAEIAMPIYRHASGDRDSRLVAVVAAGADEALNVDADGLVLTFEDLPAGATHLALNLAVDPQQDGERFDLTVTSPTQAVGESVKPKNGYRLETILLTQTAPEDGTLSLRLSSPRPLRIDGPGAGTDGVPPTLVLVAPADR
ncbi:MAG: hypothetical protein ACOCYV_00910 [Planctomycetota bacterium]